MFPQIKKMEEMISITLTIGMVISMFFVIVGGCLYLMQVGNKTMAVQLMQTDIHALNVKLIWHTARSLSPLGLIELGLLTLVATQVIRVGLLVFYYGAIRDYPFALISLFILIVLTYSLIWRN